MICRIGKASQDVHRFERSIHAEYPHRWQSSFRRGTRELRITLVNGFWGQNIGNAFFNLGGMQLLTSALGPGGVVNLIQDAPAYWTLHRKSKGNYSKWWNIIERIDTDLLVLQGPVLTASFPTIWGPTLERLADRGIQYGLLGVGHFKYDEAETEAARTLLSKLPPAFIFTRDQETHRSLLGSGIESCCGLDSAFFLNDAYDPPSLTGDHFVASAIDLSPAPKIHCEFDPGGSINTLKLGQGGSSIGQGMLDRGGMVGHILSSTLDRADQPTNVVTLTHRTNPHIAAYVYRKSRSVASDEPYTYAAIYKAASLVVTDRVHAAVASSAYGTPWVFLGHTPRSSLLEQAIGPWSHGEITNVDRDELEERKSRHLSAVRSALVGA